MGIQRKKIRHILYMLIFLMSLFIAANALGTEALLPEDLVIQDEFKPGVGASVGTIRLVQGLVIIIHSGEKDGFQAATDLPLFKKDTLITLENSGVRLVLNDGSIITLASESRLEINESVYDSQKKSRFSFLSMAVGKARFWVTKMVDLKRSEFKVRTQTAVVGVRGSDFIVTAAPDITDVVALENTLLELISLAVPDIEPVQIKDFERVFVKLGEKPSEIERLLPEEIERIKRYFSFFSDIDETESDQKPTENADKEGILVPENDLIDPASTNGLPPDMTSLQDIFEKEKISSIEENISQQQRYFSENLLDHRLEEILTQQQELPPLPGTPE